MPLGSRVTIETLWKEVDYLTKAGQRADAFLEGIDRLGASTDKIELLMKAAERCGIPKTKTQLLAKDGNIGSAIKTAATRIMVKEAVRGGAWQSAALTAVFDIRRLFDGQFKTYLINIGVSGLYGGTVNGLSSWVNHPFFGNGIVLGVVVSSAFGTVSLASTGDWARFGKGLGVGVLSGAASWGGATAGAAIGVWLGPIGVTVGGIVGGLCGSFAGRRVARQITALERMTDHEVNTAYRAITKELAPLGLEPDPSLTSRQVVEVMMNKGTDSGRQPFNVRMTSVMASDVKNLHGVLSELQQVSPDAFDEYLDGLRARAHNRV